VVAVERASRRFRELFLALDREKGNIGNKPDNFGLFGAPHFFFLPFWSGWDYIDIESSFEAVIQYLALCH